MKIILAGGSGQIGRVLSRAFVQSGDEVIVLSRKQEPGVVTWDGKSLGPWLAHLEGADVLINLAGRSVNCRYTAANRREIFASRLDSVALLGKAIKELARPPALWLQASTATIYAHRFDAPNDEASGIMGGSEPNAPETWRFSIDVATSWERALEAVGPLPETRRVLLRSAIIMAPARGGTFAILRRLVKLGLGGRAGDGRQFVSWIHDEDFVRAVRFLVARNDLSGPINLASPNPLSNAEFMRLLRRACGVPFGLPAPAWILEIAAFFHRTETELLLKSRRVVPGRLTEAGFEFRFPSWDAAAIDLCRRFPEN